MSDCHRRIMRKVSPTSLKAYNRTLTSFPAQHFCQSEEKHGRIFNHAVLMTSSGKALLYLDAALTRKRIRVDVAIDQEYHGYHRLVGYRENKTFIGDR